MSIAVLLGEPVTPLNNLGEIRVWAILSTTSLAGWADHFGRYHDRARMMHQCPHGWRKGKQVTLFACHWPE